MITENTLLSIRTDHVDPSYVPELFLVSTVAAHALGGFEGKVYLNCREALDNSLSHGCKFFETDATLSGDGHIILTHDRPKPGDVPPGV